MMEKIKYSLIYSDEEKSVLLNMIDKLKRVQFLLYSIDILDQEIFGFEIQEFERFKKYIVCEIYKELIEQLIERNKDYEEIFYTDIREWFKGMAIDRH